MSVQVQNTSNGEVHSDSDQSISVELNGLAFADSEKVKKILKMSINRKRKYHIYDSRFDADKARILISAEVNPVVADNVSVVAFGAQHTDNPHHLKAPLMSIRVLRILDGVPLKSKTEQDKTQKPVVPVDAAHAPAGNVVADAKVPAKVPDVVENKPAGPVTASAAEAVANSSQVSLKTEQESVETSPVDESQPSYRVLIVDDSVLIHKSLEIELDKATFGSTKAYAESGEQCLAMAAEQNYDLVFLDIMMPGIDGYETCTELRKLSGYKKTPIIMLSAKTSPLDEVKGIMAGCTTYLTKPIKHEDFQKLLGRMGDWLENFKSK